MAGVAYNGSRIDSVVASNHVSYRVWNPHYDQEWDDCDHLDEDGQCVGGWDWVGGYEYYTTDATINGSISSTGNVFANGKPIAKVGDSSIETDSYSVPSDAEDVETDGGGTGSVTSGNSNNVYVGGVSVAVIGSNVNTHAGVSTTIADGSSNVFIG